MTVSKRTKLTTALAGAALLGAGAVGGAILTMGTTAGASTAAAKAHPAAFSWGHPGGARFGPPETGTVTAVGKSTVTIRTSAATKTYTLASGSPLVDRGVPSLSTLKAGDKVVFSTTSPTSTTIDRLHVGTLPAGFRGGGPRGFGPGGFGPGGSAPLPGGPGTFARPESGTVTAVGSSTVTIRTSTGTKTYTVTASSAIDRYGESGLSALKAGEKVVFSTTSSSSATIARLFAGTLPAGFPGGGPGRFGPGGPGGGPGASGWAGGPPGSAA